MRRPFRGLICSLVFGLACGVAVAAAQEPPGTSTTGVASAVADEVTSRLNSPTTDVRVGQTSIPADSTHRGDLAVVDGDLLLAGRVDGDLLVVNGRLRFAAGAVVAGDVLVVGGGVENLAGATVEGNIVTHTDGYAYERSADGYRNLNLPGPGARRLAGMSDFLITTGKSYNRVEGMPIAFGPRLQTESSNPLRLQALAVYRTETGLNLDVAQMGYYVRADQYVGGWRSLRLGGTLHSVIDPIEEWQMTDLETGLATFFFHRDYRDHFERTGASLFATWEPEQVGWTATVEGRWEKHEARRSGSPWSVFRNAEEWRPQPLVAQGRIGSLLATGEYDSRIAEWNPAGGWLVRGQLEHAFHVDLTYPELLPFDEGAPLDILPYPTVGRFVTGLLDLRSYNRVNADSRLNFRVVTGGSLTGDPLPPQRQHALGGEGSLPGYQLFTKDCGARGARVKFASDTNESGPAPYFQHYGCDGFALLQAEFRGKLSFRFRWDGGPWNDDQGEQADDGAGLDLGWDMAPDWALFVDAGRGWSHDDARLDEETHVDVGVGLLLDRIGVYLAVPVTSGKGANLFVRLGPRF